MTDPVNTAHFTPWGRSSPSLNPSAEILREGRRLHEAVQEFEAVLIGYLLKTMRQAIGESGFLDGGLAQDVYEGLFDDEVARQLAKAGGMGIASLLERQLQRSLPSGVSGRFPSRMPTIHR